MSAAAPLPDSVEQWLDWQLSLHASTIELGLDRVRAVAEHLGLLPLNACSVVVAGTNGKGSCVALLESLLRQHGRTGSYTSPHLWRYNERICVDGDPVGDGDLCRAFAAVERARGHVALTYFEFGTLAALWLFDYFAVEFAVLEVGLGGRLDAVNIVDAEVSLITNIGLDHLDWLGPDRETIGYEKAGVMRSGCPVVCADPDIPDSVAAEARRSTASMQRIGHEFALDTPDQNWCWHNSNRRLALPAQAGVLPENLAAVLAVHCALLSELPSVATIAAACRAQANLAGRRERVDGPCRIIYDVGHNAEAVAVLATELHDQPVSGRTHLVLGMLADKPVEAVAAILLPLVDRWYPVGLDRVNERGLSAPALAARLPVGDGLAMFGHPQSGLDAALAAASADDRIVVCGSFSTVTHARRLSISNADAMQIGDRVEQRLC